MVEFAATQHGVVSRARAAELGLPPKRIRTRLRSGELDEPVPGVLRIAGAPKTWHQSLSIATSAGGGSAASHRSATRLHRLDGVEGEVVEVVVARGRHPVVPGVITHRWQDLSERDVTTVDGIRVTTVAVTLAQLGAVAAPAVVERALDEALRQGASLRWIAETLDRLDRPEPSGTGVLRRILDDPRREGELPESWFERLLTQLPLAGIPAPVRQHRTGVGPGRGYRLDLAWPEVRLGLEGHSRRYHFGPAKQEADHRRDLELAAAGWEVVYVTWHLAADPHRLARHLARIHAARRALVASNGAPWQPPAGTWPV
jgi:very-short-patch-repair endonuclease